MSDSIVKQINIKQLINKNFSVLCHLGIIHTDINKIIAYHDYFNLIGLSILIYLNYLNWNFSMIYETNFLLRGYDLLRR